MIKIDRFTGLAPRIHPRKLPDAAAQTAREVRLLNGNLNPLHDPATVNDVVTLGAKSFYKYNPNGTNPTASDYLSWSGEVNVVKSPLINDAYGRIYFTGDGVPKCALISDGALETGEAAGTTVIRQLGIPAPGAPSLVAVAAALTITYEWYYHYEEADGTLHDQGTFTGGDITTVTPGMEYTLSDGGALPPNGSGLGSLVVWCKAYTANGTYLGQCYPATSVYAASTDLIVNGAAVTSTQAIGGTSVTVTFRYDVSQQGGFETDRVYVYTWVTDVGEEGPPSDPVTISSLSPVQSVEVTTDIVRPLAWIVTKRIYRSVTANDGTTSLRLVAEEPYGTATYTDTKLDEELELDTLVTDGFDAPPSTMHSLVGVPGGFLAGADGRTVYFTPAFYPYAWPYAQSIDADVVAMAIADNSVVAATTEYPYLFTGVTPDGMAQTKLPIPQAGTSRRGIVSWMGRVMYTSPDGLVEVVQGGVRLVTDTFISREYWQSLSPETMRLYAHDNLLLVACDTVLLLFTYVDGGITFTDSALIVTAGYTDTTTDQLQIVLDGETTIKEFDPAGGTERTMTWRGKDVYYPLPQKMGAYRLQAASYPQTLRVYADDSLVATMTVADGKAALLPSIPPAKIWSVEIEADDDIYSVETGITVGAILS